MSFTPRFRSLKSPSRPTGTARRSRKRPDALRLGIEAMEDRVLLAAGDLDSTFGVGGLVTTDFLGPGSDFLEQFVSGVRGDSIAIQADGKTVVVGSTRHAAGIDFAVARYNPDGSLDTSFDGDGRVTTDFGNIFEVGSAVAIQADGKIVVAGSRGFGTGADFALVRYNTDGSLDTSFDGDGKVTTDFAGLNDEASGLAL